MSSQGSAVFFFFVALRFLVKNHYVTGLVLSELMFISFLDIPNSRMLIFYKESLGKNEG